MSILRLPISLRVHTGGNSIVEVNGQTVREAILDFIKKVPQAKTDIMDKGVCHPYLKIFLNQHDVDSLQGIDTPLKNQDVISILHPLAGG